MINFYKVLKRLICHFGFVCFFSFLFFCRFLSSLKTWIPPSVLVDLMNRSMHNFISRNASISHFTKRRKEKLETVDSGYRVFSSRKKRLKPFFFSIAQSHLSDCRFVYRFFRAKFCDNSRCPL